MKQSLLAVFCVVLFGCENNINGIGYDRDEAEYKWGEWADPRLISIVDDSLAVLAIYKPYYKEWYQCGFEGCRIDEEVANYHVGLFVVNYREKREPVWGDTLDYDLRIAKDYFRDSSVLVFDRNRNKFGFWKIGTKEVKFVDYSGHGYNGYFNTRPFPNGNVLLIGKPSYILDTENRQLKQFEFSGEYEWLSKCGNSRIKREWVYDEEQQQGYYDYKYDYMNISYIGGELVCIKGNETADNFELIVNNAVKDTSSLSNTFLYESITGWYGIYAKDKSNRIHKIDTLNFKFDRNYVPMYIGEDISTYFYGNQGGSMRYSTQDLLGVNN